MTTNCEAWLVAIWLILTETDPAVPRNPRDGQHSLLVLIINENEDILNLTYEVGSHILLRDKCIGT